jgi:hypothetical protein
MHTDTHAYRHTCIQTHMHTDTRTYIYTYVHATLGIIAGSQLPLMGTTFTRAPESLATMGTRTIPDVSKVPRRDDKVPIGMKLPATFKLVPETVELAETVESAVIDELVVTGELNDKEAKALFDQLVVSDSSIRKLTVKSPILSIPAARYLSRVIGLSTRLNELCFEDMSLYSGFYPSLYHDVREFSKTFVSVSITNSRVLRGLSDFVYHVVSMDTLTRLELNLIPELPFNVVTLAETIKGNPSLKHFDLWYPISKESSKVLRAAFDDSRSATVHLRGPLTKSYPTTRCACDDEGAVVATIDPSKGSLATNLEHEERRMLVREIDRLRHPHAK